MIVLKQNTMQLTLLDRIIIRSILPIEGNIKSLIIIKDIVKKVELLQDEVKKFDLQANEKGNLTWNKTGMEASFDISFTELETNEIKLCLQKLDREKKINVDMLNVVKLFDIQAS